MSPHLETTRLFGSKVCISLHCKSRVLLPGCPGKAKVCAWGWGRGHICPVSSRLPNTEAHLSAATARSCKREKKLSIKIIAGLEGIQPGLWAGAALTAFHWALLMRQGGAFPNTMFLFNQFNTKLTSPKGSHMIRNMHSGKEGWRNSWFSSSKKADLSLAGPDRGWPPGPEGLGRGRYRSTWPAPAGTC